MIGIHLSLIGTMDKPNSSRPLPGERSYLRGLNKKGIGKHLGLPLVQGSVQGSEIL